MDNKNKQRKGWLVLLLLGIGIALAVLVIVTAPWHVLKSEAEQESFAADSNATDSIQEAVDELTRQIQISNLRLPQIVGNGLTFNRIYLDGEYLMNLYGVDENKIDMDFLIQDTDNKKREAQQSLNKPNNKATKALCIKAQKGYGLKFQGNTTGKTCEVLIPYSDLLK